MMIVPVILALIIIVNSAFAIRFFIDAIKYKQELKAEPGNKFVLAISSAIIFFFSSFGISDFAISTIFYRMKKLVSDQKLPGTLNTQCVIPVAVMALAFISVIKVDILTLIICIVANVAGAYLGPRFVVKLSPQTIRKFIGAGLIMATCFIVAGNLHFVPAGGNAIELRGIKLTIAAVCLCVYGALNNLGIGSYPLTMITIYALGMNPAVTFPIMMGAAAFAVPIGSMQFIKYGQYSRKITLFTSLFGTCGVLIAVYCVKGLNVSSLQWMIAAILLYSGVNMLIQELKLSKNDKQYETV